MIEKNSFKHKERNLLIDNYRGWVIFIVFTWCCTFLHLESNQAVPRWIYHDVNDVRFGIMDYGITFFLLASGMTFKLVFEKRKREIGLSAAYLYSIKRSFGVMGIGMLNIFVKDIGDNKFKGEGVYGWEVFASIGFATIFATIFINMKKISRIIIGCLIIIVYGFAFIIIPYIPLVGVYNGIGYGGPFMAIGCSGLLLIFSVAGELIINKDYPKFLGLYFGSIFVSIPTILMTAMPGNDYTPNPSFGIWGEILSLSFSHARVGFLLLSIPIPMTALIVIWAITEYIEKPIYLLADMGKNTIIFFFMFGITHLITTEIGSFIEKLWLDIIVSVIVSIGICIGLNYIIKATGFSFTI